MLFCSVNMVLVLMVAMVLDWNAISPGYWEDSTFVMWYCIQGSLNGANPNHIVITVN